MAKRAAALLKSQSSPGVAQQGKNYFKPHETIQLLGVGAPKIREIEKALFREIAGVWAVKDALSFCDTLMRNRFLEAKAVGILLLSRFKKEYRKSHLRHFEKWILEDLSANWATTDALSGYVIAPLIARYPDRMKRLHSWTASHNPWLRRAAAVSLVPPARRGEQLDDAYEVAQSLFDDSEDLLHKATGWLLREAGKTDPSRLEAFLLSKGTRIPRTALRYAIEKFPPTKRKELLRKTKRQ
jgi:3-methyladenine DNA glycosylase AlkD